MRDLQRSERNRVAFRDTASDTKIVIYYATPTTSQIRAYRKATIRRKGGKVVVATFDPGLKFGLEIITAFDDGCFGHAGKPISCDPNSPDYREDWKQLLAETASDIVTMVAQVAFDGLRLDGQAEPEFDEGEEEAEDILPLGKS